MDVKPHDSFLLVFLLRVGKRYDDDDDDDDKDYNAEADGEHEKEEREEKYDSGVLLW